MDHEPDHHSRTRSHAHGLVTSVIHAGGISTTYHWLGRGPAVLLLSTRPDCAELQAGASALGASFRVIVVDPSSYLARAGEHTRNDTTCPGFDPWLRGILDGLGVLDARLLADEQTGPMALTFAATEPERVSRIAVFLAAASESPGPRLTGWIRRDGADQPGHEATWSPWAAPVTTAAAAEVPIWLQIERFLSARPEPDG